MQGRVPLPLPDPAALSPCCACCLQMAACHLGAPDPALNPRAPTHPLLPFVLVQGPPGTGKTHTVKVQGCACGHFMLLLMFVCLCGE